MEEIDLLNMVESKRNDIIELTRSLIRIPSVIGEERDGQNFISDRLGRLGLKMDVWEPKIRELKNHPGYSDVERCEGVRLRSYDGRPNVVATLQGSSGGRSLILNGHVDVVPSGSREMWSRDPWGGELENGRLYGRGAVDMKGGLAAIIAAAEIVCEAGASLKGNLIVESVVDEESGGNGTLACLLRGHTGDAAIVAEPSQLMMRNGIALASTGSNQYRIRVKGRSGHPTNLQFAEYVSAADKASAILGAIKNFNSIRQEERLRLNPPLYRMFPVTNLIGVGKVKAGEWPSMMPNLALIEGSLQCYPGEDLEETKEKFVDYIANFANLDPWMRSNRPEIEFFGNHIIPTEIGIGEPIVTTVQAAARKVWKVEPVLMGFPAGSDLRIFTEYGRIPGLIFGPGGGGLHAVDEFVNTDDVVDVTKTIVSIICSWCRMEG